MSIPNYLSHKPIYKIEEYAKVDGYYKNNTDVVGLSLGKAQWEQEKFMPSVKVWRKVNKRFSRQSEETTLTRALDMATLIIKVLDKHYNGKEIHSIDTVFDSVEITEAISNNQEKYISELNEFLNESSNHQELNAHIDVLFNAINEYKKF